MNNIERQKITISEIFKITLAIQNNFPQFYTYLDETPLFLSYSETGINPTVFEKYLETIKMQLIVFEKNKGLRNNV